MNALQHAIASEPPPPPRKRKALRVLAFGIAVAAFLSGSIDLYAEAKPSEYDVKAAYLFNFGKFIRLSLPQPAAPRETFDICVFGQDPIGEILDGITANEQIDSRTVRVIRVKEATQARTCDIAYVGESEAERIESDLSVLAGADVLTVSDSPTFLARGGMIQFVLVANHVRFAVNLDAVKRTHLVLSSELLRVAYSVSGKPSMEALP